MNIPHNSNKGNREAKIARKSTKGSIEVKELEKQEIKETCWK